MAASFRSTRGLVPKPPMSKAFLFKDLSYRTPKVCKIMALLPMFRGFGSFSHILLGLRRDLSLLNLKPDLDIEA